MGDEEKPVKGFGGWLTCQTAKTLKTKNGDISEHKLGAALTLLC